MKYIILTSLLLHLIPFDTLAQVDSVVIGIETEYDDNIDIKRKYNYVVLSLIEERNLFSLNTSPIDFFTINVNDSLRKLKLNFTLRYERKILRYISLGIEKEFNLVNTKYSSNNLLDKKVLAGSINLTTKLYPLKINQSSKFVANNFSGPYAFFQFKGFPKFSNNYSDYFEETEFSATYLSGIGFQNRPLRFINLNGALYFGYTPKYSHYYLGIDFSIGLAYGK